MVRIFAEYSHPDGKPADLASIAKETGDLAYVTNGNAVNCGFDLDAVVAAVHASNMTKLDIRGLPIIDENGKTRKSDQYRPPVLRLVEPA
jgi:predicted HAD superfamily Cof-like phosphohydrolase